MVQPRPQPLPSVLPVTAHEWRWLALAVVLGAAIRLMYLDRVAVEHFDEGVYAANVWFGAEEGYQYPLRQFYAPPLLPALIEWCYVAWGFSGMKPPAWLPMVPSLLCGIATIPSAWWIARRWFGAAAGYAGMWLVALNEFHAAYSRTALTDVPVTLAILWAVFAAWKLLLDPTAKHGLLTGGLTAIAWWLKYSGWLPLAILLVGGAVFQCLVRPEERRWKAWGIATAVAILTAVVLWIPVWRDCLAVGGYGAVSANHRGYIMGWSSWVTNLVQQSHHFGRYAVITAVSLYVVVPPFVDQRWKSRQSSRHYWPVLCGIGLVAIIIPTGLWVVTLAVSLGRIVAGLGEWSRGELSPGEIAAAALASTWFCGLLVATPLYQPYPRLLMPWWMAASLLVAWAMSRLASRTTVGDVFAVLDRGHTSPHEDAAYARRQRNSLIQMAAVVFATMVVCFVAYHRAWENRRGLSTSANTIADQIRSRSDSAIVQVYGLPPVVLTLREHGIAAVVCGGPEAAARLAGSWVIVSSDADRDSTWNDDWPKVADQFELVREIDINPSSIVRLDSGLLPANPPPVEVRVYRRR